MSDEQKAAPKLIDVLKANLPGASEKVLAALEEDIKAMYETQQGFRMQWRTKLIEVVHPEDKDLPKEKQRVMFRFQVMAGDFVDKGIELHDFSFQYRVNNRGGSTT